MSVLLFLLLLLLLFPQGCQGKVVLYNRVSKAGSTTLLATLRAGGARVRWVGPSVHRQLSASLPEQRAFLPMLKKDIRRYRSGVLDHHAPVLGTGNYYRINQLRDPVDRYVSKYYYSRYFAHWTSERRPPCVGTLSCSNEWMLTIDECAQGSANFTRPHACLDIGHGGDTLSTLNDQTFFVCGYHPDCDVSGHSGARAVADMRAVRDDPLFLARVARAKHNVAHLYDSVGILERMGDSLRALRRAVPVLRPVETRGVNPVVQLHKGWSNMSEFRAVYMPRPSPATRAALRDALWMDQEVYDFASGLLDSTLAG